MQHDEITVAQKVLTDYLESKKLRIIPKRFDVLQHIYMIAKGHFTAEELYEYFIEYANGKFAKVQHGVFGASMDVELVNSGPFTVILEDF